MSAKLFNLPIKLSRELVAKLFSATQIQKAQNYLIQGRVLEVTASKDNHDIESYVEGSAEEPYRQEITLVNVNHKVVMRSHCTCPVRGNCKHVAAAMLSLVDKKPVEEQRLNQWLKQLDDVQPPQLDGAEIDRVIYTFSSDPHGVYVEFKRSRLNKKGQFNKGSKLQLVDLRQHIPSWVLAGDKQIVHLLLSVNQGTKVYLEGEFAHLALGKILAQGLGFWEESRTPIRWREPIEPAFVWCEIDKKHTQMQMSMPGLDNWEFVATQPAMFVELDYFKMGHINTDLSVEKLKLLQHMPPVPLEKIDTISHTMLRHFSPKTIPVPSDIEFYEIDEPMQAIVTFTMLELNNDPHVQPVIELAFQYGDVIVPAREQPERISLVKKGHVQYQIHRNVEAESSLLEQFTQKSLRPIDKQFYATQSVRMYFTPGYIPEWILSWSELSAQQSIAWFESLGIKVIIDDSYDLNIIDVKLDVDLVDEDESGWFSLSLNADIEGQNVPLLALVARWLQQNGEPDDEQSLLLPGPNGQFIKVKAKTIKPLVSIIQELFNRNQEEVLQVPRSRAHLLNELSENEVRLLNGERVRKLAKQLEQFNGVEDIPLPRNLHATLRDYQKQGYNWLCFLKKYQLGGILADDMGLGKTIQTLAFLLGDKQANQSIKPSLIVCPTSLVGNWLKETNKFTPSLKVVVIHGSKRQQYLDNINDYDIVITTYPLILRDHDVYADCVFEHIILDEAQLIKNDQAKVTQVIKTLRGHFRLCLSGTPLENHLGELKSLMDFCLPGLLGQHTFFQKHFRGPIEKQGDVEQGKILSQRVAPFMLRRTKKEVVSELPEKTVIVQSLTLEKDQRNLYESIRLVMEKKLRELFAKKGVSSSQIEFLDALLKLRQACCDPRLVKLEQAQLVQDNAKLAWLKQTLPDMLEEGRKILIFSQFTGMLAFIEQELQTLEVPYSKLTGQTRHRQEQIDAFQDGDKSVFLISLKAGGTGLNLTTADTVIHFDPWWNPAAERQATDRAHRIGQQNPVFVYKLIAQGTVEEKIQEMQVHKQGLADRILSDTTQGPWKGNADDLLALLS
ncbi:SNF2-related protein [Shewanella intestini]|uniref:DEAD/DEAH box helicase family protein n=1 Tax=Shewanella intestini TaxID=2017544 RepID=A0ABS5HYL3_9GAMM|nr:MULTISPECIES: DEAD/DEAH box helicase [Shewanella]MBR9726807.1 DEAD/DEAH box helicase family protein [Shewanella intestini]MRG34627.1 helicase [Shewanella sp. XMDDZSB0408]